MKAQKIKETEEIWAGSEAAAAGAEAGTVLEIGVKPGFFSMDWWEKKPFFTFLGVFKNI